MTFTREAEIRLRLAIMQTLSKRRNQRKEEVARNIDAPVYAVMPLLRQMCEEGSLMATLCNTAIPGDESYVYSVKG